MLKIRQEQMEAFSEASIRKFEARAMAYLAGEYPQEYQRLGEDAMRNLTRKAIKRTKRFQMSSEAGVIVYAELSIVYGEDFYRREPWAPYILHYSELDAEAKVERLRDYLFKQEEQEVSETEEDTQAGD